MPKILTYSNQKGGVGKTTLLVQTAFWLSQKGYKTLVIDTDPQGNSTSCLAPRTEDDVDGETVRTLLLSGTPASQLFEDDLAQIEVLNCPNGIDLIHTPTNDPVMSEVAALPLDKALNPQKHLAGIVDQYDYVLIDTPPALGRQLVAALALSTHVICPVQLSGFSIDGLHGLLTTIIGIKEHINPDLVIAGVVVNGFDKQASHTKALSTLQKNVPDLLLKNLTHRRGPVDEAMTAGVPIWEQQYGHVARKEFDKVMSEIFERVG